MLLLDSNIFIYSVLPEYQALREWVIKQELAASEVSLVEVLGYHRLTAEDEQDLRDVFSLDRGFSGAESSLGKLYPQCDS